MKGNRVCQSEFNVMFNEKVFNIGIQFQFSDNMTLLFMPEYRIQFTDSYQVTDSYNHFGRALGFDLGLTYKL